MAERCLSDEELQACLSAMRNGHAYFGTEYLTDGDGEDRVMGHIAWLEAEIKRLSNG